jgi:hypothetical protein
MILAKINVMALALSKRLTRIEVLFFFSCKSQFESLTLLFCITLDFSDAAINFLVTKASMLLNSRKAGHPCPAPTDAATNGRVSGNHKQEV